MTINVQSTFDQIAEEQEKGYRGARVDPHPNSAYSMESDPMTSPSPNRYGQAPFIIDEYADPNNPYIDQIHGRQGLDEDDIEELGEQVLTKSIPAQATAGTAGAAVKLGKATNDGTVTGAKFTPVSTITGNADDNRTFKVYNKTKDHPLFTVTTTATKTGGTSYDLVADGSNQSVSAGDDLEIRQSVAGTGVAHGGAEFVVTLQEQGTAS